METKGGIDWILFTAYWAVCVSNPNRPPKKKDNQAFFPAISCSTFLSANCTAILS